MMTTRSDLGFERLLSAIAQDLIDASEEEILTTVNEFGLRPGMKGSVALFGVTFALRRYIHKPSAFRTGKSSINVGTTRGRRRPKGDTPSST